MCRLVLGSDWLTARFLECGSADEQIFLVEKCRDQSQDYALVEGDFCAHYCDKSLQAISIVGGGDVVSAVKKSGASVPHADNKARVARIT